MRNPADKPPAGKIKSWQVAALWLVAIVTMPILIDSWRHREAPETVPRQLLLDVDGKRIDLFQMSQTEPVLLYFWASWCPVCKAVSPAVEALRDDYAVVTVALSSGSREKVLSFAREHDLGFQIVNDPGGDIGRTWNVRGTPTIAVLYQGHVTSMTSGITTPPGISIRLWLSGLLASPLATSDAVPLKQ
ncbi:Sporulation thiol-disulfide oxidoreductase A [Halioglobus japonicus]|nr:Sporulation thiol-disulfide oxidoreductase A [Halioglobus japonicus]